jgi:short subunit dehydrogenase-like uncharacterized protein
MEVPAQVLIVGATGHLGRQVALYFSRFLSREITWGVAGRSERNLSSLLETLQENLHGSVVPHFLFDLSDKQSLENLTGTCKLIINCLPWQISTPLVECTKKKRFFPSFLRLIKTFQHA